MHHVELRAKLSKNRINNSFMASGFYLSKPEYYFVLASMKTITILFLSFILGAACIMASNSTHTSTQKTHKETVRKRDQFTNKDGIKMSPVLKTGLLVYLGRYASDFRTFMPFDQDPCNHAPSAKSFC